MSEATPTGPDTGGRLNTWKEIATYLGKGVRTVERWERDLRLPVHRVASARGESVYALKREIDDWLATVDRMAVGTAPPRQSAAVEPARRDEVQAPSGIGRRAIVAAGVLLSLFVLAIAAAWWLSLGPRLSRVPLSGPARSASGKEPGSWRLVDGQIAVFDSTGTRLWSTALPVTLRLETGHYGLPPGDGGTHVALEDIDGDGHKELLVVPAEYNELNRTLYCYNDDGTRRFERAIDRSVCFGRVDHTPPFTSGRVWLTPEPGGRRGIWFVAQHVLGPSVVCKVDAAGRVLSEYWEFGHVSAVREATLGGRHLLLVGGTNNESGGSSLAVLDYDRPAATAPAVRADFRCSDCPAQAAPRRFFVFPLDDVSRALGPARTTVELILPDVLRDRVVVQVAASGRVGADVDSTKWAILYSFDRAFTLVNVAFVEGYGPLHARLQALGLLRHPFGASDYRKAARVLSWTGTKPDPVSSGPLR